jgi:hypothetical protein
MSAHFRNLLGSESFSFRAAAARRLHGSNYHGPKAILKLVTKAK